MGLLGLDGSSVPASETASSARTAAPALSGVTTRLVGPAFTGCARTLRHPKTCNIEAWRLCHILPQNSQGFCPPTRYIGVSQVVRSQKAALCGESFELSFVLLFGGQPAANCTDMVCMQLNPSFLHHPAKHQKKMMQQALYELFGSICFDVMFALTVPMSLWWLAGTLSLICIVLIIIERGCEAVWVPPFLTFALCGTCASDMMWLATNAGFGVLGAQIERWRIAPEPEQPKTSPMENIRAKLTGFWLDMCIFTGVWFAGNLSFSYDISFVRSVVGFLLMVSLLDLGLSLWHHVLHLPCMYTYHKVHHSVRITQPWTNEVEHPVEALGNATVKYGSLVLVSNCVQLSPNVAFAYFMFSTWYGVMVHSGYNLPPFDWISQTPALWFIITPQQHQAHHLNGAKKLGAITSIWDSLFQRIISMSIPKQPCLQPLAASSRLGKTWPVESLREISDDQLRELVQAVRTHGMIVIPNQSWSLNEQEKFTSRLGELTATVVGQAPEYFEVHPRIVRLSNFRADGTWKGPNYQGAEVWHQDGDYMRMSERHILTVLCAEQIPTSGGGTGFVDLVAAAAALPASLRAKAEGLRCFSSARRNAEYMKRDFTAEDAERFPDQWTPVLHRHPRDGRELLLMGSELSVLQDQKQPDPETTKALFQHVLSPRWMYFHQYKPGDVIIWDNLQTLHKALPFINDGSDSRLLWRAQARVTEAFPW